MANKIKRPEGHHTITPGFSVPNAAKVITFLEQAFGSAGKAVDRYDGPGGAVMHAEVMIGDSVRYRRADARYPRQRPRCCRTTSMTAAVDAAYKRALSVGATSEAEPKNEFHGYCNATVKDPGGNKADDLRDRRGGLEEEMHRRMADMMKG
jgi:uncharacterized glyoxalase superfamily protein PhnB